MKYPKNFIFSLLAMLMAIQFTYSQTEKPVWKDHTKSIDERIDDLISRLTIEEKISQLVYNSKAIPRLNIPAYNWWNECLHGVARNGKATVFPQAIGLAATFDEDLIFQVATAISDEARAKFKVAQSIGNRSQYAGLTFWTPNINIFRDPRWGRGQETYGEDPYLTGRIGTAFVKGLQGDNPRYLKAAACAKHYAVHSGPEADRHVFNAVPPKKDFYETYLPAFETLVREADVEAVMCAYNRTYDEACCGSSYLLEDILRKDWGFDGHIVSDCWAIVDFHEHHKITDSPVESAALAINSGVNVNCGNTFPYLREAFEQGLVKEKTIDNALKPLLKSRFKLGLFDPPVLNPYYDIPVSCVNSDKHRQIARKAAAKSLVLLKNDDVLPLNKDIRNLYVLGPYATDGEILLGNYYGASGNLVTILEGIVSKVSLGSTVQYKHGFLADRENINPIDWSTGEAHDYDAIIVTMGISGLLEGEEGESIASPHKGDRPDIGLPENQVKYLKKLRSKGDKPIIVIMTGGSPISIPEVYDMADAIVWAWYPGEQGGNAIADVIFGDVNPSGRLSVTFPQSVDQLPPYEDYSMEGRTYKYMTEKPLFPFGFGLSYSKFEYKDIILNHEEIKRRDTVKVVVQVKNVGDMSGEDVVQLYLTDVQSSVRTPAYTLCGFERVELSPGEQTTVTFEICPKMLRIIDKEGRSKYERGDFKVTVGGCSPGDRAIELGAAPFVETTFTLK